MDSFQRTLILPLNNWGKVPEQTNSDSNLGHPLIETLL